MLQGQRVQLSTEEIKMLRAMGVQMPARFPLNQVQERALRTVRRKIRNKLSAQASRARRQEYVADLEYRVQLSDKENERLRRQVAHLQNDKRCVMLFSIDSSCLVDITPEVRIAIV